MISMATKIVDEKENYGTWVWKLPNGRLFGDGTGSYLSMPGKRSDLVAMVKMREAAQYYGVAEGGQAVFMPGRRQITESEYAKQSERAAQGLIADEYDFRAVEDELNAKYGRP